MADEEIKVCMDVQIPQSGEELALTNMWPQRKRLRVRFLGGDNSIQEKVKAYASQWESFANIAFDFGHDPKSEIRIAFNPDGSSWSAVGTDALNATYFPQDAPTMNFGWLKPDSQEWEFSRVVLHEFGHALGCIHEHQNPSTNIPWNKEAVYRYYGQRGWSKERVNQNLFAKYAADHTNFTAFDRDSIMLYPIPKELTDGVYEVGWNTRLSETDKGFIGEMYPKS